MEDITHYRDATAAAAQLGRLDFISSLLAAIGLILVLGGAFAYVNFRSLARSQAKDEAKKVAEEVAERIANEYLQRELPDIIEPYIGMMGIGENSDDSAGNMAETQENSEGRQE